MRAYLHGKEWIWCGDVLCLRKDEDLHREVARLIFKKVCDENGPNALDGITALCTDFETGLWRPFLEELNKHKYR